MASRWPQEGSCEYGTELPVDVPEKDEPVPELVREQAVRLVPKCKSDKGKQEKCNISADYDRERIFCHHKPSEIETNEVACGSRPSRRDDNCDRSSCSTGVAGYDIERESSVELMIGKTILNLIRAEISSSADAPSYEQAEFVTPTDGKISSKKKCCQKTVDETKKDTGSAKKSKEKAHSQRKPDVKFTCPCALFCDNMSAEEIDRLWDAHFTRWLKSKWVGKIEDTGSIGNCTTRLLSYLLAMALENPRCDVLTRCLTNFSTMSTPTPYKMVSDNAVRAPPDVSMPPHQGTSMCQTDSKTSLPTATDIGRQRKPFAIYGSPGGNVAYTDVHGFDGWYSPSSGTELTQHLPSAQSTLTLLPESRLELAETQLPSQFGATYVVRNTSNQKRSDSLVAHPPLSRKSAPLATASTTQYSHQFSPESPLTRHDQQTATLLTPHTSSRGTSSSRLSALERYVSNRYERRGASISGANQRGQLFDQVIPEDDLWFRSQTDQPQQSEASSPWRGSGVPSPKDAKGAPQRERAETQSVRPLPTPGTQINAEMYLNPLPQPFTDVQSQISTDLDADENPSQLSRPRYTSTISSQVEKGYSYGPVRSRRTSSRPDAEETSHESDGFSVYGNCGEVSGSISSFSTQFDARTDATIRPYPFEQLEDTSREVSRSCRCRGRASVSKGTQISAGFLQPRYTQTESVTRRRYCRCCHYLADDSAVEDGISVESCDTGATRNKGVSYVLPEKDNLENKWCFLRKYARKPTKDTMLAKDDRNGNVATRQIELIEDSRHPNVDQFVADATHSDRRAILSRSKTNEYDLHRFALHLFGTDYNVDTQTYANYNKRAKFALGYDIIDFLTGREFTNIRNRLTNQHVSKRTDRDGAVDDNNSSQSNGSNIDTTAFSAEQQSLCSLKMEFLIKLDSLQKKVDKWKALAGINKPSGKPVESVDISSTRRE